MTPIVCGEPGAGLPHVPFTPSTCCEESSLNSAAGIQSLEAAMAMRSTDKVLL